MSGDTDILPIPQMNPASGRMEKGYKVESNGGDTMGVFTAILIGLTLIGGIFLAGWMAGEMLAARIKGHKPSVERVWITRCSITYFCFVTLAAILTNNPPLLVLVLIIFCICGVVGFIVRVQRAIVPSAALAEPSKPSQPEQLGIEYPYPPRADYRSLGELLYAEAEQDRRLGRTNTDD
jgi:hypothetical protein